MNPLIQTKTITSPLLLTLTLLCFGFFPKAQVVIPPPDGGYPGFNTAEGQNALFSRTTGVANTGVGWYSLWSNTDGSYNTGIGAGTLLFNIGDQTTGDGTQNTAIGAAALLFNTTGFFNTATGATALLNNSDGSENTATGAEALSSNTTGNDNTANGWFALFHNNGNPPEGSANTAVGAAALFSNTTGDSNTAIGLNALANNTTGSGNTAVGVRALDHNTSGSLNIALGVNAGMDVVAAQNTICIGLNVFGADVGDSCFIGNIFGETSASGAAVYVNSNHRLGTLTSSRRFKDDIKPMERISEALFALKPVTFHYKKEIDPAGMQQFGLVAEEVEKVNPDLVVRDKEGKPYSVRYEQVNAMLLNEFLKEHKAFVEEQRKVQEQGVTIARLEQQIEALTAGLQRVSAQLELNKPAPQTVKNKD
jgi:trimeric autotransporter adhesin